MNNNKDSSNGINRKSFKRTGRKDPRRKGTRPRNKATSKGPRNKGTRRKGMRRKNTRLKNYSKRKNLKSNTKMKGGMDSGAKNQSSKDDAEMQVREQETLGNKIIFGDNALLWERRFASPRRRSIQVRKSETEDPYPALEQMEMVGKGDVLLGEGSFGQVRKFTMKDLESGTTTDVAVKIMIRNPEEVLSETSVVVPDSEYFKLVYREYEFQRDLSTMKGHSKYFAKVYNFFQLKQGEQYGIVMELLEPRFSEGLELLHLIKKVKPSNEYKVHYSLELARAISATHKMGFVHGDLEPENVAIANDGTPMGQLKLMDFGVSFIAGDGEGEKKIDCCRSKEVGSPLYFSYELLLISVDKSTYRTVGADLDWWAYGIMVYEIVKMKKVDNENYPGLIPGTWTEWGEILNPRWTYLTIIRHWEKKWKSDLADSEHQIEPFINKLTTNETERLLLNLAFQFLVPSLHRPFLCLDERQMKAYDGTTKGVRAEALQGIVAELEKLEPK